MRSSLVVQWSRLCLPMQADIGSIPGLGISSGEGNGNPLYYSCLGSQIDRGVLWATQQLITIILTYLLMHSVIQE